MGQTTPVVIQDKNGKTTTVHRSTAQKTPRSTPLVPVPPVPVANPTEITNDHIIALLEDRPDTKPMGADSIYASVSTANVDDALDFIHETEAGVLPYAAELMTSGSATAQEMTKRKFSTILNNFAASISERDTDPEWDIQLPSGAHVKSSLNIVWNIGNVLDESGMPNGKLEQGQVEVLSGFINTVCRKIWWPTDEVALNGGPYWRGVAALTLTETVDAFPQALPEHSKDFIIWASAQENIADIISIARERQVLHPETIEGIMQQTGVEEVLRNGLL